jgi:thymidylate synthase
MFEPCNCYASIDEIQEQILDGLLAFGSPASPRGLPTIEARNVLFTLQDPRRRCVLNPARRWSLPLAIGELCWHLSGSSSVDALSYYASIWRLFASPDGKIRGSCYGSKMFVPEQGVTRWNQIRQMLISDPDTRRAIIYFGDSTLNLSENCVDVACATSLQFLIRDGKLDATVCMRSNDVILGLPYDLFLFTFLQELLAAELRIEVGEYHHFASSLHLYKKHVRLAEAILQSKIRNSDFLMPRIKHPEIIRAFLETEESIRLGRGDVSLANLDGYWRDLAEVLLLFKRSRSEGWEPVLRSNNRVSWYIPLLLPLIQPARRRSDLVTMS